MDHNPMLDHLLANFALHVALNTDERAHIRSLFQHRLIKKNAILLSAGDVCRAIYFVHQGCLRMYHTDPDGSDHIIQLCPEDWWSVDISSFSGQTPAFYSISALEDTDVLSLGYATLEGLYEQIPKLERFFRILTQNGFSLYQQRITSNLSNTARERYALFQEQYPKLEQRISQKHIASYLGITPVFLSMLRKQA